MSFSCLVLGGSGFIGSHVCEALLRGGHRVRVLVPEGASVHNLEGIIDRIEVLRSDLNGAGRSNGIWGGIDRVFHLACTTRPKTANDDPARDLEDNLVSTVRMLDRCVANNVGRVIFISSGGTVYGRTESLPIHEDHPIAPICSYGIHKATIERYLCLYKKLHGLDYRVARVANAYGERQTIYGNQGLVGTVLDRILSGQPIHVFGKGEAVRDYIYVGDIVAALVRLAESDTASGIFNVGSGRGYSVLDIIRIVEAALGLKAEIDFSPARSLDVDKNILDITRMRKETGWAPQVSIEEGITRTAAWWRKELLALCS
jgi:UDP-glucose 4-epimerase